MEFFNSIKKWFYSNNSSAASSDARIPLLDASGNPIGSDTMANLASVLGVGRIEGGTSADNLTQGFTAWWFSTKSEAEALGFVESGNNLVFAFSFDGIQGTTYASGQLCFAQATNGLYFRTKDSGGGARWGNWVRVYDTSLLTNSTMLGQLANALGAQYNTQPISDFDDVTASGKYFVSGSNISNAPRDPSANCRGFLFVEYFSSGFPYYCQRYIETVNNTNKMWIRTHDTTWSSWKEL